MAPTVVAGRPRQPWPDTALLEESASGDDDAITSAFDSVQIARGGMPDAYTSHHFVETAPWWELDPSSAAVAKAVAPWVYAAARGAAAYAWISRNRKKGT
ncbi:unnamed protein product, partial [Laminaria digitata]